MQASTIVIAGGNGFLGHCLREYFTALNYRIVILSRSPSRDPNIVTWDGRTLGAWVQELEGAAALINLAGRSVDCRYTDANKRTILASRLESTRILGEAVAQCQRPPAVWLNSSTATIYQHTPGEQTVNTEAAGQIGSSFSEEVAKAWEEAFWAAPTPATRRVALRTAIVLGRQGGALPVLARLARWGLCSPQGSGQQWISWLHSEDFCRAVEFFLRAPEATGVYNLCAPHPVRNRPFNQLLYQHFRPIVRLPQPAWLLELGAFFLRTETELILKSRKVYPQRLLAAGFTFRFPTCEATLADLLS
ncbi:TIGR01777 family oxidoreductase [Hymenobacter defluvii]|uniref:TIGR01777 family oxidoreductase n=1 Tax=Hymenobacter defluvii TaxID=2054411 RepID=A0ABS3TIW9_9BACT|nr:TIGR01777 family oxidoreductase [Hymenobacter defluvii]MBO3272625.1 TIGR01777 family oxidoreductase [Hymenobacter defluvii]